MPHCGIQGLFSTNWNPACASSQPRRTPSEMMNVATETARPKPLTAVVAARGKNIRMTAPAIGSHRKMLSRGIEILKRVAGLLGCWVAGCNETQQPSNLATQQPYS